MIFKIEPLNKISLTFFIIAKAFGIIGVSLGFLDKKFLFLGGIFIFFAIFSIFLSIALCLVQLSKDKKRFAIEDEEKAKIKMLKKIKIELEEEIFNLQNQKSLLTNLALSRKK